VVTIGAPPRSAPILRKRTTRTGARRLSANVGHCPLPAAGCLGVQPEAAGRFGECPIPLCRRAVVRLGDARQRYAASSKLGLRPLILQADPWKTHLEALIKRPRSKVRAFSLSNAPILLGFSGPCEARRERKNGALKNERPGRRICIAKAFSERHSAPLVWNARPSVGGPQSRSVGDRCHGASRANGRAHCARRSETWKGIVRRATIIDWGARPAVSKRR
jgi:hypothetical protein